MNAILPFSTLRNTIVGKLAATIVSESIGALAGAALGQYVGSTLAASLPRLIIPLTALTVTSYWLTAKKASLTTAVVALSAAYFGSTVDMLPRVGHFIGTIGGGFLGLRYMNKTARFWSEKKQSCYAVASSRYELVGRFFQSISIESSIPLLSFPLNATVKLMKVVFQNAAFQSHSLIPFLKGVLGKRPDSMKWSIAVALKEIFRRYSDDAIENQIRSALYFDEKLLTAGFDTVLKNELYQRIGDADNWTSFLLRALPKYADSLSANSEWQKIHKLHKTAFFLQNKSLELQRFKELEQVLCSRPLTWVKGTIDSSIEGVAQGINKKIADFQMNLIGTHLFTAHQEQYIERVLPLYFRGFLSYLLTENKENGHSGQTLEEEQIFFHRLSNLLIHSYIQTRFCGRWVDKLASVSIHSFYSVLNKIHDWIAISEQTTILTQEPAIHADYLEAKEEAPLPQKSREQITSQIQEAMEEMIKPIQKQAPPSKSLIHVIEDYAN